MTTYGITSAGFTIKPLVIIRQEINASLQESFGNQINLNDESVFGQLAAIWSEREAEIWEEMETLYNSYYPDGATYNSLDHICSINNIRRLAASYSKTAQTFIGTAGTVITAGSTFSVANNETVKFALDSDVTIATGTDTIQTIVFTPTPDTGSYQITLDADTTTDLSYSSTDTEIANALNNLSALSTTTVTGSYTTTITINFTGADGQKPQNALTVNTSLLFDGVDATTAIITTTQTGVLPQITGLCTCTTIGAVAATANTVTIIDSPVAGLDSTTNTGDATLGNDRETDADLRIRRVENITTAISGTVAAIENSIAELNNDTSLPELTTIKVVENDASATDAQGRPGKSFEAYVYQDGGVTTRDSEITEAIWLAKPAGIETTTTSSGANTITGTYTDDNNFSHTVNWSRPEAVRMYASITLTTDSNVYPSDGDTLVTNAITTWGNNLGVGQDVIAHGTDSLESIISTVDGITDIVINVDRTTPPVGDANVVIDDGSGGLVEFSQWTSTDITITS